MSDAELKEVTATISGTGSDNFEANEIILSAAVNALPTAVIKGARADGAGKLARATKGAVEFSLESTADKLSDDQNDMFKQDGEREITIDIACVSKSGGKSTRLNFSGLSTAPGLSITTGKVLEQKMVMHKDKRLSSLNLSIYELTDEYGNLRNRPTCDPNKSKPVASMLEELINWTITSGELDLHGKEYGISKYIEDTHTQNGKIFNEVVKPILQKSSKTSLGLGTIFGEEDFTSSLINSLHSQADFLQTLVGSILPTFIFQMVTNFDDGEGQSEIRHSQSHATPSATESVDVIGLQSSMGAPGELPLGQIILSGTRVPEVGNVTQGGSSEKAGSISHYLAVQCGWPTTKKPKHGQTKHIVAPRWLEAAYCPGTNVEVKPGIDGKPRDRIADADHQDALNNQNDTKEHLKTNDGDTGTIPDCLKSWAQKHYIEQALQNHTCNVEIPLDLDWGKKAKPVGQTYTIKATNNKDGGGGEVELFKGYLRAVNHSVGIGQKQGRASTNLQFTHVKGKQWSKTKMDPPFGHSIADWVR